MTRIARSMALVPAQRAIIHEIQRLHARRVPLNISAVKRSHPKLIEGVYAVRPFWGWKRALEDAGLDYTKINVELRDYVDCKICGRDFGALSFHLSSQHNVTTEEYREEYPGAELTCETVRAAMTGSRSGSERIMLPPWEAIWSPEYVLDRMAELQRRNFALNRACVSDREQSLTGKATQHFGSWDEALRRIGLDPERIRLAKPTEHLTREQVIARLEKRREEGLALNFRALEQDDPPLQTAARKYFGSHECALRAVGIDPAGVRKVKKHEPEELEAMLIEAWRIAGLRGEAHRRAWLPFRRKYYSLAEGRFGGWKGVCAIIGVPVKRLIWKRFPDRKSVMAALRERARRGKSLGSYRIFNEDLGLYQAVLKHVGKFHESVYQQFGIEPPGKSRWWRADKTAIIAELRRRKAAGEPLSWKKIIHTKSGPAFLHRATALFGFWSGALAAAGLDPFGGARSPWRTADKAAILEEIYGRQRGPRSLRYSKINKEQWGTSLLLRAKTLFGSWNAALLAAGLAPEGGKSPWAKASEAAMLAEIRRRKRAGKSLLAKQVTSEKWGRALLARAAALFGSWTDARVAAGFNPPVNAPSPWVKADQAAIVAEIRRRGRAGESMATTKIESEKWGSPLLLRSTTLFGSWAGALLAAGVALPAGLMSPWAKADQAAILAEICERKRARESLRSSKINREQWGSPLLLRAKILFGSWNAALLAAGIDPPAGTQSPWSKADKAAILAEIRRRQRARESLRYGKLQSEQWGKPLLRRAKTLFGSWTAALLAAGVDPPAGTASPWPTADKAAILTEIRGRKIARESLRCSEIRREKWGRPLLRRSESLFGSWNAALLAAGITVAGETK